jgi:hypothetical protein
MADFRAQSEDLLVTRGDSPVIPVTITSDAVAVDITGFTFTMTVNASDNPVDDTGALFQISGTVVDGPSGRVDFQPAVLDLTQTPDKYNYDIQMVGGGSTRTILKGSFSIDPDITRTA